MLIMIRSKTRECTCIPEPAPTDNSEKASRKHPRAKTIKLTSGDVKSGVHGRELEVEERLGAVGDEHRDEAGHGSDDQGHPPPLRRSPFVRCPPPVVVFFIVVVAIIMFPWIISTSTRCFFVVPTP